MQKNKLNIFLIELDKFLFSKFINKGSLLSLFYLNKNITLDYISNKYFFDIMTFLEKQDIFYYDFSNLDKNEFILYFSLKKDILSDFKIKFEEYIGGNNSNIKYIGEKLGFPDCCVKNFYHFFKNIKIQNMKYHMFDFIKQINSTSESFNKYLDIFQDKRLIFHTSCIFSCYKSLDIAYKTSEILNNNNLGFNIESYNYLYFETNDFIKLDKKGKYIGEGVYYEYNEKGNRKLFDFYKKLIISNGFYYNNLNFNNSNILYFDFN